MKKRKDAGGGGEMRDGNNNYPQIHFPNAHKIMTESG